MDLMAKTQLTAGRCLRESPDFTLHAHALCVNVKLFLRGLTAPTDHWMQWKQQNPLAQVSRSIVVVSGAVDIITNGQQVVGLKNGVAMLRWITATGCAVTGLIAAFVAVNPIHAFEAAASALSIVGLSSEIGMDLARGPASLRMHLIDSLHGLDQTTVLSGVNIINVS